MSLFHIDADTKEAQREATRDEMRAMHGPGCGPIPDQTPYELTPEQEAMRILDCRRIIASGLAYLRGTSGEPEWQAAYDRYMEQLKIVRKGKR